METLVSVEAGEAISPAPPGTRLERIRPSGTSEEYVSLEPDGSLVHQVSPARGYLHRLVPGLRPSFRLRATERLFELRALWNRRPVTEPERTTPLPSASPPVRSLDLVCCTFRRPGAVPRLLDQLEPVLAAGATRGVAVAVRVVTQEPELPGAWLRDTPALGRIPWLHFVESAPGLPRARNAGVRQSRADAVLFIDDDVVPARELVSGHLEALDAHPRCIGVAGAVDSRILGERSTRRRDVGQVRASGWVDTNFDSREEALTLLVQTPLGANMCFRRERMEGHFGSSWFDERLDGSAHREETTTSVMLNRLGELMVFAPRARLLHLEDDQGGCENRGELSQMATQRHLVQDHLFFRRFYRRVTGAGPLLPLLSSARALRGAALDAWPGLVAMHLRAWLAAQRLDSGR